jgi:hypothetical protein
LILYNPQMQHILVNFRFLRFFFFAKISLEIGVLLAGPISDEITRCFNLLYPSSRILALGLTQPVTGMSRRRSF